ncbi:hypothetical protein [Micrococcus luteus]|uniref:hypothetical protein n=1 Tax=Micrococcus luteus TaxID=1270 RepID=UPI00230291A3|nr:hypothetical protein [Micrococcus luteus]
MTEQTTTVTAAQASICPHGIDFTADSPEDHCRACDWCDTCKRVTAWAGEACTACGRIWGTAEHTNAFTMLRPTVTARARGIQDAHAAGQRVPGRARTALHEAAGAVAALAPIPQGIAPRLRRAMIDATHRAMVSSEEPGNPFTVARVGENDWAVLRAHTAAGAGLSTVASVGADGVATLN